MRIIKISTDNMISVHKYPESNVRKTLFGLIGNYCSIVECVKPQRLYRDLGAVAATSNVPGEAVALLVDEEGLLKENAINAVASFLYGTDKHSHPIVGNVLVIGVKWERGGVSFCGIEDSQFEMLYPRLKELTEKAKKAREKR